LEARHRRTTHAQNGGGLLEGGPEQGRQQHRLTLAQGFDRVGGGGGQSRPLNDNWINPTWSCHATTLPLLGSSWKRIRIRLNEGYIAELFTHQKNAEDAISAARDRGDAKTVREQTRVYEEATEGLAFSPEQLRSKVYKAMQERGEMPPDPPEPQYGRTLAEVTEFVRATGKASPARTWRQRMAQVRRIAETRWNDLKDSAEIARLKAAAAWKSAVEMYTRATPKDTEFRDAIKNWKFADEWTGQETRAFTTEINKSVPDSVRQGGMTVWLEAGGDMGLLRLWAASVPERWEDIYRAALTLTPKEKALALRIKSDFETKLRDGMNAGLIEKGRENYGVPQVWKIAPKPKSDQNNERRRGSPGTDKKLLS
jgi:hypothetical protein